MDWFRRLSDATKYPKTIEDIFAFAFMAWSSEEGGEEVVARLGGSRDSLNGYSSFRADVDRLKFDVHGAWRISQVKQLFYFSYFLLAWKFGKKKKHLAFSLRVLTFSHELSTFQ